MTDTVAPLSAVEESLKPEVWIVDSDTRGRVHYTSLDGIDMVSDGTWMVGKPR